MGDWNEQEAAVLMALQRGIPLTERPFADAGARFGLTEEAVMGLARRLLADGSARRFGAVFDARRLGYRSALCAMRVGQDELTGIADKVAALRGVTHAYARGWPDALPADAPGGPAGRTWPNLWFTLAERAETFERTLDGLRAACAPHRIDELPALRRFKIDVVFELRTRERDERVEPRSTRSPDAGLVTELDDRERETVRLLQGELPVRARFFEPLAAALDVSEAALLERLRAWQAAGVMRRIGLLLRHREIGFKANGMCCWDVPETGILDAGRRVAAFPEVTHCYERPKTDRFPFRLYAMIHTPTWEGTQRLFERIAREAGLSDGQLLLSLAEFKKTSMQFF